MCSTSRLRNLRVVSTGHLGQQHYMDLESDTFQTGKGARFPSLLDIGEQMFFTKKITQEIP